MIIIYDVELGVSVQLDGKIKETPRKVGYNELTSISGRRLSESIRKVLDLDVNIEYLDFDSYDKLVGIFLYSNNRLEIEDTDTGKSYTNYFITGETLELEKYEDYENKKYYYKGSLKLYKR